MARVVAKNRGERDSLKHSDRRNKRIAAGRAVTGFGKAVGMGPIARARIVNPQFSDANAGQRGYNRRHFPAGDAARMEGGTTPSPANQCRGRVFVEQKRERLKKREHSSNVVQGRSFSCRLREFLIIWNVGKFFNSTIDPCRLIYD